MSSLSIAPYFPFRLVRVDSQQLSSDGKLAEISIVPDRRFGAVCYRCGERQPVHSWHRRPIRDLDFGAARVKLVVEYRYLACSTCRCVSCEDLELFEPYQRVTKRLARYIHELCKQMTVREVAVHLALDWKTVKEVDKRFLEERHGETDYEQLRILAIDEISVKKHHRYLTVVLDYESGRVVWLGKDRKATTLARFFAGMSEEQRAGIEAVAMDMWEPYIQAVTTALPQAKIVFDLFHVVAAFNKVIDRVRLDERAKAAEQQKPVYKGTKYLLLKNRANLRKRSERKHLAELLALNRTISETMILKEELKRIWSYRYRGVARKHLQRWCRMARAWIIRLSASSPIPSIVTPRAFSITATTQWAPRSSRVSITRSRLSSGKLTDSGMNATSL